MPEGWEWTRLSNIASFSGGKTPSTSDKTYWGNDVLWVTSKDMKTKYIESSLMMLSDLGAKQLQIYPIGTLLMVVRSGILRHTLPLSILSYPATINQDLKAINFYYNGITEYIYFCLKAFEKNILQKYTKAGATVENIEFNSFKNIILPIAPEKQMESITSKTNDIEKVFCSINKSKNSLYHCINNAKSKILDLAIRGKLVPQDPNDEPASALLERIKSEKEKLIKQGKIKRNNKQSVIFKGDDNSYYEKYGEKLPIGWAITNFETLLSYEQPINYIVSNTDYKSEYKTPVLTAGKSFILGYTNEEDNIFSELPVIIFDDFTTESKYVDFPFKVKSSAMKILHINTDFVLPKYVFYLMQATKIDHDNHQRYWISTYSQELVALPPINEQERILSALEQYFKLLNCLL